MSNVRVRSYLDGNAPQFNVADKNGIIPLMKAMFEQESYGSVTPTAYEQDLVNNQLILTFAATPGFSVGNLIQIVGSSKNSINQNYFRVSATDGLRLYLKYDYTKLEDLTSGFIPSALVVRHAPLGWEVVYSSSTQFSIKSKDPTSSKNIVTFKTPSDSRYPTSNGLYFSKVHISKVVNTSTGEISEDYFQSRINELAGNTESPYFIPIGASYYNYVGEIVASTDTTTKYPWYIISTDKFFYLILGSSFKDNGGTLVLNYSRLLTGTTSRSVFMFGDPDKITPNDPDDPTGFLFNAKYQNPISLHSNQNGDTIRSALTRFDSVINVPATNRAHNDAGILFLRDYNNLPGMTTLANVHTISFNGQSIVSPFTFPGPFLHGISFFPTYVSSYLGSGINNGSFIRSKLPLVVFPLQSLRGVANTWVDVDYKVIKTSSKDVLNIVTSASASTLNYTVSFELD